MSAPTFDQSYLDLLTDLGEPISVQPREKKPTLALVNAASLADKQIPQREWLVDEIIPMRQVTFIYGDGSTGKTLIELQLSVAVVTGTDWLGNLPKEGNVLILSAEDDIDETHRRLADIVAGREFSMAKSRQLFETFSRSCWRSIPLRTHSAAMKSIALRLANLSGCSGGWPSNTIWLSLS
jgi:RecA-family ATPase